MVATGETHSVRELVELAFGHVGLDWQKHVVIDPAFMRPAEVDLLMGDPTQGEARARVGAHGVVPRLVAMMVDADLRTARARATHEGSGYRGGRVRRDVGRGEAPGVGALGD